MVTPARDGYFTQLPCRTDSYKFSYFRVPPQLNYGTSPLYN